MTPISKLSGMKELGKLKHTRGSKESARKFDAKLANNTSLMDGGDMDVKEYMKTLKKLEDEKAQFKREIMTGGMK